eukprot:7594920-Pyramimonas_sp.AAC.1
MVPDGFVEEHSLDQQPKLALLHEESSASVRFVNKDVQTNITDRTLTSKKGGLPLMPNFKFWDSMSQKRNFAVQPSGTSMYMFTSSSV